MPTLLSQSKLDETIRNRKRYALIGLALMINPFLLPVGWGFGLLTGFTLCSLALYALTQKNYRSDPGLWSLAAVFSLLLFPSWIFFELLHIQALFKLLARNRVAWQISWREIQLFLDSTCALFVFGKTVRFTLSAMVENWKWTQEWARGHASK